MKAFLVCETRSTANKTSQHYTAKKHLMENTDSHILAGAKLLYILSLVKSFSIFPIGARAKGLRMYRMDSKLKLGDQLKTPEQSIKLGDL